jgi:hypothetical protein
MFLKQNSVSRRVNTYLLLDLEDRASTKYRTYRFKGWTVRSWLADTPDSKLSSGQAPSRKSVDTEVLSDGVMSDWAIVVRSGDADATMLCCQTQASSTVNLNKWPLKERLYSLLAWSSLMMSAYVCDVGRLISKVAVHAVTGTNLGLPTEYLVHHRAY